MRNSMFGDKKLRNKWNRWSPLTKEETAARLQEELKNRNYQSIWEVHQNSRIVGVQKQVTPPPKPQAPVKPKPHDPSAILFTIDRESARNEQKILMTHKCPDVFTYYELEVIKWHQDQQLANYKPGGLISPAMFPFRDHTKQPDRRSLGFLIFKGNETFLDILPFKCANCDATIRGDDIQLAWLNQGLDKF